MNTTMDARVAQDIPPAHTSTAAPSDATTMQLSTAPRLVEEVHPWAEECPPTIILQPNGRLDSTSSPDFKRLLEKALVQARDGVIVDFLWVHSIDDHGIAVLVAGIQQATVLGKIFSFQSMNHQIRTALDVELNRQREVRLGSWSTLFQPELESFLGMAQKWHSIA